jgi:hypothetical protein
LARGIDLGGGGGAHRLVGGTFLFRRGLAAALANGFLCPRGPLGLRCSSTGADAGPFAATAAAVAAAAGQFTVFVLVDAKWIDDPQSAHAAADTTVRVRPLPVPVLLLIGTGTR